MLRRCPDVALCEVKLCHLGIPMEFTILCHCPLLRLTFFATTYFHLIKLLLVGLPWHANAHETGGLFWKSAVLVFLAATFIQK